MLGVPDPDRTGGYHGVGMEVPAAWPVIDGAHDGGGDPFLSSPPAAFLGPSYAMASSGGGVRGNEPPPADGLWATPQSSPPPGPPTTLADGETVYVTPGNGQPSEQVWLHQFSVDIGIGPEPSVARSIEQSLFGNYSAQTPARMNPDGSTTPLEQDLPVWVIEANAVTTAYGTCGTSVIAPYDARTGGGLYVEESG